MLGSHIDISTRKQAEAALIESEEKFAAIFAAAPGSMMLSSLPDGKTVEVNDNFTLITGYSREEALGKTTGELGMWADPNERMRFLSLLQTGGLVQDFEADLKHNKSDEIRNGLLSGHIITVQGKKYLIGTFYDITGRKRAEEELRGKQQLFQKTFDISPLPSILTKLPERIVVDVNPAFGELFGYTRAEMIGRSVADFDLWADASERAQVAKFLLKTGSIRDHEFQFKTKSGETGYGIFYSQTIEQMVDQFVLTKVMNITECKRAEDEIKKAGQRLRDLIDGLGPQTFVGLMMPDGTLIEANRSALTAAGLKPEDVLGKPFEETYWWAYSPEVQHQLRQAITRAAYGEASRYDVEARAAEDQFITLDFSLQPLRDETGAVVFLIPSANVITERKQAEEQLRIEIARTQALLRVASRPYALRDFQAVADAICEETAQALHTSVALLYVVDKSHDELQLQATVGMKPDLLQRMKPIPLSGVFAQSASATSRIRLYRSDEVAGLVNRDIYAEMGVHTIASARMFREGELLGVLVVYLSDPDRTFSQDELDLLRGIADQAAQATLNAQLLDRLNEHVRFLSQLQEVSQTLHGQSDADGLIRLIFDALQRLFDVDRG